MKSYSRYCSAPANVTAGSGVQSVASTNSSRYVRVAAHPLHQLVLVVTGVDGAAGDHRVVVEGFRVGAGGCQLDGDALRADDVGDALGDPAGVAVRARVDNEEIGHAGQCPLGVPQLHP